jgi:hypothetical protein
LDNNGIKNKIIGIGKSFQIVIDVGFESDVSKIIIGIQMANQEKMQILNLRSDGQSRIFGPFKQGTKKSFIVNIPGLPLYPGIYFIEPWVGEYGGRRVYDHVHDAMQIIMEPTGHYESESIIKKGKGLMFADCIWEESSPDSVN